MSQTGPNDPQPQEDPTHDVPVYPEQDPPPDSETPITADNGRQERHGEHQGHGDTPPGESEEDDVDEDDLDPQKSHSPPDVGYREVIFDESRMPG